MNRTAVGTGLVFLAVGILSLGEGYSLRTDSGANQLHQALEPGTYVLLLGAVLVVSGAIHLLFNARNAVAAGAVAERASPGATRRLLLVGAALVGDAILMSQIGYVAASLPFFAALFRIFGIRSWAKISVLSIAFTAIFYVVFVYYFGLILPQGILRGTI